MKGNNKTSPMDIALALSEVQKRSSWLTENQMNELIKELIWEIYLQPMLSKLRVNR